MLFGDILRNLRQQSGLSQKELSTQIKRSQSIVADWENSNSEPTASAITTLAAFFDVSTDFLLGKTNEYAPAARPIAPPVRPSALAEDEAILLEAYRTFSPGKKKALFQMLEIEPEEKAKNNII